VADASGGARYTHGHAESVLRSHRSRTAASSAAYLLAHLRPGQRLLDVGSGPGTITADLASLVAPGEVVAIEVDDDAASLTRQGAPGVDVRVADVHELPFADEEFDVVHAHQVLQHVADPVQALREMARVTRPGGLVAARDSDYATFAWWPRLPGLDRWLDLYCAAARANGGMWADRIVGSALADQLVREDRATRDELDEIAAAWRAWAADPDGWFSVHHGEILCRIAG
jgi:SAM-dependent methyltransferase